MRDKRKLLKIKIKSLAAEARIIRMEEKRTKGELRDELHNHRVVVVRAEARASQLAYAFIRGKDRARVEPKVRDESLYDKLRLAQKIVPMVKRYGPPAVAIPAGMAALEADLSKIVMAWLGYVEAPVVAGPAEISTSSEVGSTPARRSILDRIGEAIGL